MKTALTIASVALCMFTPSCGSGDRTGTYVHDFGSRLEAIMDEAPEEMNAEERAVMDALLSMEGLRMEVTLNPDHTYSWVIKTPAIGGNPAGESTVQGTWEVDGDQLTLHPTRPDGQEAWNVQTGTFVGNSELHLAQPGSETLVMKKG